MLYEIVDIDQLNVNGNIQPVTHVRFLDEYQLEDDDYNELINIEYMENITLFPNREKHTIDAIIFSYKDNLYSISNKLNISCGCELKNGMLYGRYYIDNKHIVPYDDNKLPNHHIVKDMHLYKVGYRNDLGYYHIFTYNNKSFVSFECDNSRPLSDGRSKFINKYLGTNHDQWFIVDVHHQSIKSFALIDVSIQKININNNTMKYISRKI